MPEQPSAALPELLQSFDERDAGLITELARTALYDPKGMYEALGDALHRPSASARELATLQQESSASTRCLALAAATALCGSHGSILNRLPDPLPKALQEKLRRDQTYIAERQQFHRHPNESVYYRRMRETELMNLVAIAANMALLSL